FYAILASQGLRRVVDRPAILITLGIAGAVVLLMLAAMCFRGAWQAARSNSVEFTEPAPSKILAAARNAYLTGVLMTLLNPMTIAFWFVAAPGTPRPMTEDPRRDLPINFRSL